MKKLMILGFCCFCLCLNAQSQVNNIFDEMGIIQTKTTSYNPQSGIISTTEHRAEDVIWSRVVYRIIDMRYKQNYQLYFPTSCEDPEFRSLFKVIVDAIVEDQMPVYGCYSSSLIKPDFREPISKKSIPNILVLKDTASTGEATMQVLDESETNEEGEGEEKVEEDNSNPIVRYDSNTDQFSFQPYAYEEFVRNQIKYVIMEVVFFDRHYSRLYSKIMAIAPLNPDRVRRNNPDDITGSLINSLLFWIPFDTFRPYLRRQFIRPQNNDDKRVTYDEFFTKKLYTSYILGDGNIYNRIITDYVKTPEEAKKEQDRIAAELLNFEQDLWEY